MNFKEIFTKYKNGTANEDEIKYIENELEKNNILNEYMEEELRKDFSSTAINNDPDKKSISNLKKSVNKKFAKNIKYSIYAVLVLLLAIKFILAPLLNSFYFNPNKGAGNHTVYTQFFVDMYAYTELFYPGTNLLSATAENYGVGKYNILVNLLDVFNSKANLYTSKFVKNKSIDYSNICDYNIPDAFHNMLSDRISHETTSSEMSKLCINELKSLPENAYVSAYITFNKDLSLEKFVDIQQEYTDLYFAWIGIKTSPDTNTWLLGINPNSSGDYTKILNPTFSLPFQGIMTSIFEKYVPESKYPNFELYRKEVKGAENYITVDNKAFFSHEVLKDHITSLLKYLSTRDDLNTLVNAHFTNDFFSKSLDYINSKGASTYGTLIYGKPNDILNFLNSDFVDCIYLNDVKLTRFSK